jgi:ATP-binding protein involved in chromosome partitioning
MRSTQFGVPAAVAISKEQVKELLSKLVDPTAGKDYVTAKEVKDIRVEGANVSIDIELGYPADQVVETVRAQIKEAVTALPAVQRVDVVITVKIVAHLAQRGLKLIAGVKNVIAVASGKGGVGKSTTAVNLALALAAEGAQVGILDADIYGPSLPMMLGLEGKPESRDGKTMEPMQNHGVKAMSIGLLIPADQPMVWRGPMVTQALEQLLRDTQWGDLDYLVVDLPPGTGDIQLTLAQKVPVTGAVIVTTPQDIALIDARKGLKMFEKVGVPILGLVENMSTHICSQCGHEEHIFGTGGAARMGADYEVEVLGALPLDIRIREQTDSGQPTVVADRNGRIAEIYRSIARKVAARISALQQDRSGAFPKIVVQNT